MDEQAAIEGVRALLPPWAGWAPLAVVAGAGLSAGIGAHLAVTLALLAHRGVAADAHWTERARRAWPARVVASAGPMLCGVMLGVAVGSGVGPLSYVPATALGVLAGIAAFAAAYPQLGRVDRRVRGRRIAIAERLAGQAFAFLAVTPHVLLVLFAAVLMPAEPVPAALASAVLLALLVAIARGAGLRLAAALGLARPADARLGAIVDACAEKVGVRATRVWIVRWPMVNALAFPRTGELAFTEEAVAALDDEHLAGVTAHELGHLGEPRSVVLARSLGLLALFPIALVRPLAAIGVRVDPTFGPLIVPLALVLGALVISRIVARVARKMEERADAIAHAHEEDEGAYARALERIYELNLVPAVTGAKRPVHPHLYDRLLSAGLAPGYPRPAPPPRAAQTVAVLALIAACGGSAVAWTLAPGTVDDPVLAIALRGGGASAIGDAGQARWEAGDLEGAIPYYRAVVALDDDSAYWPAELARLLAWHGDCEEAQRALYLAASRAALDPYGADLLDGASAAVAACEP